MQTLRDLFDIAGRGPIHFEGRELRASLVFDVTKNDKVNLRFQRATDSPVQGLGVECRKCELRIANTVAKNLALWTDTAPKEVLLEVVRAKPGATITIFNQWRDEKYGSTMYHLNNAAIEVVAQADGSVLLRCSDGWGEPDFDDLVVSLVRTAS